MIIKLNHFDNFKCAPGQEKQRNNFINVFQSEHSDNLKAYFLRSRNGTYLIVNSNLTAEEQAKAISIIKLNIKKCGITDHGIIFGNWIYKCGGMCCNQK